MKIIFNIVKGFANEGDYQVAWHAERRTMAQSEGLQRKCVLLTAVCFVGFVFISKFAFPFRSLRLFQVLEPSAKMGQSMVGSRCERRVDGAISKHAQLLLERELARSSV